MATQWWKNISPHFWAEFLGVFAATILLAVASVLWTYFSRNPPPLALAIAAIGGLIVGVVVVGVVGTLFLRPSPPTIRDEQSSGVTYRRWQPPTAMNLLGVLPRLQNTERRMTLKFMATNEGKEAAQTVTRIFETFGWQIKPNTEDGSHVFPAKETFRGVRTRHRPSAIDSYDIKRVIEALLDGRQQNLFQTQVSLTTSRLRSAYIRLSHKVGLC